MSFRLLDYSELATKNDLPYKENRYNEFGFRVIQLLEEGVAQKGIHFTQALSHMGTLKSLLGPDYVVGAISKPARLPKSTLRAKIRTQRLACIISGIARYIIIHEKKLR